MKSRSSTRPALFFLAPALIAIGVFSFVPVIAAFILRFTDYDVYSPGNFQCARFIGFRNYVRLFEVPVFWKTLANTCCPWCLSVVGWVRNAEDVKEVLP